MEEAGPHNPEVPSNMFLKILKMGSISARKHEMDILVIWDQYLQGNMKWRRGTSLSLLKELTILKFVFVFQLKELHPRRCRPCLRGPLGKFRGA